MQLTFDEIIDILDLKNIPSKRIGYSLQPDIYKISELTKTLEEISPDNVKVTISIDDIRLKSKSNIDQTLIFTKNDFFSTQY